MRTFLLSIMLGLFSALPAYAVTVLDRASADLVFAGASAPTHVATVPMPYHWDRLNDAVDGRAHFSIAFASDAPDSPQAIYIPRIGNTFELMLNGVVIGKMGTAGNKYQDFSNQPRFFRIPNGILRSDNTLDITIDVQGGRNGGLSAIMLGAEDEVEAAYTSRQRWQVAGALVISVISVVLGTTAFILWCRQRDSLYLLYAASELLWVVYVSDTLIEYSPLPWPWWGVIHFSAYAMSAVLMFKFSLQVMGLHKGNLKIASDWNLFLTPLVVLIGLWYRLPWLEQMWKIVTDIVSLCIIATIVRHGFFSRELERRVLAISLLVLFASGIRDDLVLVILPYTQLVSAYHNHFGVIAWARYIWCVFGISLVWIIAERMRKSTQEIAGMNNTLVERLAQREAELNAAFAFQSHVNQHQAMIEERQRLTRDMHDGLGNQLLGALHLAQDVTVTREALTSQLRETLDHLKLTVDAMQDTEGDIASLLGSLRYRLGPRLEAAGIHLTWSVESLPAIASWTLQQSRDLQMILFEAFSNLIAHSGATQAALFAAHQVNLCQIQIVLQDNGRGFDADAIARGRGHGIVNMQMRATRINAKLDMESALNATKITLTLPLL